MVATVVTSHDSSLSSINIPRSLTDVAVAKFDVLTGYGQIDQFPSKRNCSAFLLAKRIRGGIINLTAKKYDAVSRRSQGGGDMLWIQIFLELPLTIAQTARLFGGAKVFAGNCGGGGGGGFWCEWVRQNMETRPPSPTKPSCFRIMNWPPSISPQTESWKVAHKSPPKITMQFFAIVPSVV